MTMHRFTNSSDQDSDIGDALHPTITEEDSPDYIMSFDSEGPNIYSPPAHIAARISKSRNYHRKSSAASSRRNSIASHHSSRSGRSAHGGPQSTHVAQHLRRASIIESRKAKAADRNAHAEKVRLRAAMNKAAPRGPVDSEEKAVAAKQARERYLAQVRANCAAEVQRSKRIAEEQRERKAAEYLKMKADMAERHAQAEKRKALLEQSQKRPRTAQSQSEDTTTAKTKGYIWKPRNEWEAAQIIQTAWRRKIRRRAAQNFMQLGVTAEAAQNSTFEEFGEHLNREEVVQSATKLLRLFHLLDEVDNSKDELSTVKTFLSSFLVLGQPNFVLNRNTDYEKEVIASSEALLMRLNEALDLSSEGPGIQEKPALERLHQSHTAFKAAFAAWRSQDSEHMISTMVVQFVELDSIWQSVKNDTAVEVTEDYKEGIRHNQTLVITRLKKLAGHERAMRLIKEAIRKSRKSKAQKKAAEKNKPRIAPELADVASPSLAATETARTDQASASSGSRYAARESLQSTTLIPDNRVIIHELAINKQWTIDSEQRESHRNEIIHNAASQLQQGLDAGMHETWIPALAESLLQKLSNLLPPDKPTFAMVKDILDPQMVAQQVQNGTFSYDNFFDFMNSILPKLCAPVRDDEVKALSTSPSDSPVKQMARIYFIVELMVLDMLNFQLVTIAPTLLKESVSYEERAFGKSLDGRFPTRTYDWWKAAKTAALTESSKRTPSDAQPTSAVSPNRIYMHGLVDLAISTDTLLSSALPETLELDFSRLTRMRSDVLRLITIASVMLNAKNLLRRDTRSLWKTEAARMWDLPLTSSANTYVAIVESRYALPPTTKTQLTGFVTRILSEAKEGRVEHAVMKVLLKKIKAHVLARLVANSEHEREKLQAGATEVLGGAGMVEFVGRIGDTIGELQRVAEVDREAHGRWYDGIVEKLGEDERQE